MVMMTEKKIGVVDLDGGGQESVQLGSTRAALAALVVCGS